MQHADHFVHGAEEIFRGASQAPFHNRRMTRVAVIEDDQPTSNQLAGWIRAARPGITVDQWFDRDSAEAALAREPYDVVLLDIELGRERHAGVALINAINKQRAGVPVLVVSAMPAAIYRSIMKALDAWDYLQKTTFEEADFIETFLEILRVARERKARQEGAPARRRRTRARSALAAHADLARRAHQPAAHGAAHPRHAVPAARRSRLLRGAVRRGEERPQPRQRAQARRTIRDAFREVDPALRGHRERADARLPLGGTGAAQARMKLPDLPLPHAGGAAARSRVVPPAPADSRVFLLLALATLALAVVLLQDEKQRSLRNYQQNFRKTQADVHGALAPARGPAGPAEPGRPRPKPTPLRPLVLPYRSARLRRPGKALQAVDPAGCSVIYPDDSALCVGVGSNAYAGGYLYLVGSFVAGELAGRDPETLDLSTVHQARIQLEMRGEMRRLGRAFRAPVAARRAARARPLRRAMPRRHRQLPADATPLRDFRGWVWQSARLFAGRRVARLRAARVVRDPSAGGRLPRRSRRIAPRVAAGGPRPHPRAPAGDGARRQPHVRQQCSRRGRACHGCRTSAGCCRPGEELTHQAHRQRRPLAVLKSHDDAAPQLAR